MGVPWARLPLGQLESEFLLGSAALFGSYFLTFALVVVNGLVAACFVGIVVTTFLVTRNGAQAATPHPDLSNRFYDVYSYCNDYANDESDESAAYYDNPVTNFF